MAGTLDITLDVGKLVELKTGIENLAATLQPLAAATVNTVAKVTLEQSKVDVTSQVRLTRSFVDEKTSLTTATTANPVAVISGRGRGTTLIRFGARQLIVASDRAKGSPKRGIPKGKKAGGVGVSVKTAGSEKAIGKAFFMPLKRGVIEGSNGQGVFIREGKKLKHLYGPSVDQVLKGVFGDNAEQTGERLEQEFLKTVDKLIGE